MRAIVSRREFFRIAPLSAAGVWAGVGGFTNLATSLSLPREVAAQAGSPANRPFLMLTLGDSIMWGQGLPENMKFRNIVASWIQGQLGGRPVKQFAYAHSGAQIMVNSGETDYAPNLSGEIPRSYPSITRQALNMALNDVVAGAVDLILLDGGINDVGIASILLPTNSTGKVQEMADGTCVARMGNLLQQVKTVFPKAAIVVTGYFQIASEQSDIVALTALISALGVAAGVEVGSLLGIPIGAAGAILGPLAKDQTVRNSVTWKNATDSGFGQLVVTLNQQADRPPRAAFASPTFGAENCFAAPNSYLFNVAPFNRFSGVESAGLVSSFGVGEPSDPLAAVQWNRARACLIAGRKEAYCADACMGHPNPSGAQAYAAVVLSQIQTTLAPYLATRGLVENPACPSLRAQEGLLVGQITTAQSDLATNAKEQQDCQAGTGGEPSHKPKQCGAAEYQKERERDTATLHQAGAQLAKIRRQKSQAGCWY